MWTRKALVAPTRFPPLRVPPAVHQGSQPAKKEQHREPWDMITWRSSGESLKGITLLTPALPISLLYLMRSSMWHLRRCGGTSWGTPRPQVRATCSLWPRWVAGARTFGARGPWKEGGRMRWAPTHTHTHTHTQSTCDENAGGAQRGQLAVELQRTCVLDAA
eukprot:scaffold11789_cov16-Tisochrysis_lutea.AAC.1